ncbi:HNH endonuclease, partial [Cryobacterium sp. TMT2-17-1]|uniref:HNH endonuclease signature motif containing protein n=1 Tax=Cryobacterium sp. TMT2-17-1 TaxID=1259248 RepID=UPI00106CC032
GGCIIPGCTVPAAWCEVHHVTPWHRGGKTEIDNGVLLCWYHHHSIDTSGWNIRMIRGTPQVRAPYCYDPTRTWRPGGGNPANRAPVSAGSTSVNVPSRNRVTTAS